MREEERNRSEAVCQEEEVEESRRKRHRSLGI
jgi:hypothetical protein